MRYLLSVIICCIFSGLRAQERAADLPSGTLVFQDLDCGPLCDAIEAVTPAWQGHHFSHVGIIDRRNDGVYVIEAIGAQVQETRLDTFLKRTVHACYAGMLRHPYDSLGAAAIRFARKQIGVPYDADFLYDNGKYYCSELVYDAYKAANGGKPFFRLYPMTYKEPGSGRFFPVWQQYFKDRNEPVPEGKPGCNPGGLACSAALRVFVLRP